MRLTVQGVIRVAAIGMTLMVSVDGRQPHPQSAWRDFGGGPDSSHFVAGGNITKANVHRMDVAWTYSTRDNASYVFNPIVVDETMYVLARNSALVALDATSGREIWVHEGLLGIAGRGINYWESADRRDRRLLIQIRNQLQAIDARTGLSITSFGKNGYVDLREGLIRDPKTIGRVQSGTPGKIFGNLILLGSAPGESFLSPPGDLRAFDVRTGALVWQFHTIPRPGDRGYDTWPKDAWKYVGGVNTWGEISIDEKRGLAFFPVGSATYDFYGADRSGLNLFSDCILVLDARTGKYRWHFQEVHHDLWDYDPVSAPQLLTIRQNGRNVDVVAHAGKTGFLYVLERETGKPIWPIEERAVPTSTLPDERAWPTQPFPTVVPPFARQRFTVDDINPNLAPNDLAAMRERVAAARNDGIFTPPDLRDTVSMPGNRGGSNWGTVAAIPPRGLMFVLSIDAPSLLRMSVEQPGLPMGGIGQSDAFLGGASGAQLYARHCQVCHGADRGGSGEAPSLVDITARMGNDVLESTVRNGSGRMPPFSHLSGADLGRLLDYLATADERGDPSGRQALQKPSLGGPVVASGGAPAGQLLPQALRDRSFGLMDGPPYPEGVKVPGARYFTGWNVLFDAIAAPWNTLTAYDLNTGAIKWKHGLGDLNLEQRGLITTDTGLVFLATSDAKIRAYDADTGAVLWTGDLPAGSRSIPAMYAVKGRQYLVVAATQPIAGQPVRGPRPQRAYVAFALRDTTNSPEE